MVALEAKAARGQVSMGANTPVSVRTEVGEVVEFDERHEDPYEQAEKHWKELGKFTQQAFGETGLWFASMLVFEPGSTFDVPSQSRNISTGSSLFVALDEIPDFIEKLSSEKNRVALADDQREALIKAIIKGPGKIEPDRKGCVCALCPTFPGATPSCSCCFNPTTNYKLLSNAAKNIF